MLIKDLSHRQYVVDKEREMSRVLIKTAWGSDDPTKAAFAFLHGNALAEAGHEVQIFLLGEAVSIMRTPVANAIVPVGWPPLAEILQATIALEIRIRV
jgi:predicted peroxiredoxin